MNDDFGIRLKEERLKIGKGSADFADICGVGKNTQTNYEKSDRKPDLGYLSKAHDLGCDIMYIITGEQSEQQLHIAEVKKHDTKVKILVESEAEIPFYGKNKSMLYSHKNEGISWKKDWLDKRDLDKDFLTIVTIDSDSMEPTINHKDELLVDTHPIDKITDGIYVIHLHGDLVVKRLQRQIDSSIEVLSDNTAYKSHNISSDKFENINLVGKVVWVGKDL